MATWWGFGLPYSLFSWLLDPMQLRWVLICYAWEVPVAGCLGPVLFPLLWFRTIERHWDHTFRDPGAVDPAEAAALEREILDFPMWVALVMVVTSLAGYGVGAVQVRLFAQLPATELFKVAALGLATGLVGGLFAFLYLESLLAPLLRRFGVLCGAARGTPRPAAREGVRLLGHRHADGARIARHHLLQPGRARARGADRAAHPGRSAPRRRRPGAAGRGARPRRDLVARAGRAHAARPLRLRLPDRARRHGGGGGGGGWAAPARRRGLPALGHA